MAKPAKAKKAEPDKKGDPRQNFAARLKKLMTAKGWRQADLVREASRFYGKDFGRYNVSYYLSGRSMPTRDLARLDALCRALDVTQEELLPDVKIIHARGHVYATPFEAREIPGTGNVHLMINQEVPWPLALKIMELLRGHHEGKDD